MVVVVVVGGGGGGGGGDGGSGQGVVPWWRSNKKVNVVVVVDGVEWIAVGKRRRKARVALWKNGLMNGGAVNARDDACVATERVLRFERDL